MQAIEVQCAQQRRALEGKLEKKVEELKETHQQVRDNSECSHFSSSTGHLLQLQEAEDDVQKKFVAQLEDILEEKQAKNQSSDAATQFIHSDIAECKLHARILKFSANQHRLQDHSSCHFTLCCLPV